MSKNPLIGSSPEVEAKVASFMSERLLHDSLSDCITLIGSMRLSGVHHRKKARGMLISGPSGVGKSTIAERLLELSPRREEVDRTIVPVLYVELSGQPTAKVIGSNLLEALGDPHSESGSAEDRLFRAAELMRVCGVELIILDEFHHIANLDPRKREIALDTIKNLMNKTFIPILLLGGNSSRAIVRANPELSRRCTPKIELEPFSTKDAEHLRDFRRLLKAFHGLLPTTGSSALIDDSSTGPLYQACHGLIGQLSQLLEMALKAALYGKSQTLSQEALRWAFERTVYPGCKPHRNPFDAGFDGKPLVGLGEPFHDLRA